MRFLIQFLLHNRLIRRIINIFESELFSYTRTLKPIYLKVQNHLLNLCYFLVKKDSKMFILKISGIQKLLKSNIH